MADKKLAGQTWSFRVIVFPCTVDCPKSAHKHGNYLRSPSSSVVGRVDPRETLLETILS